MRSTLLARHPDYLNLMIIVDLYAHVLSRTPSIHFIESLCKPKPEPILAKLRLSNVKVKQTAIFLWLAAHYSVLYSLLAYAIIKYTRGC